MKKKLILLFILSITPFFISKAETLFDQNLQNFIFKEHKSMNNYILDMIPHNFCPIKQTVKTPLKVDVHLCSNNTTKNGQISELEQEKI